MYRYRYVWPSRPLPIQCEIKSRQTNGTTRLDCTTCLHDSIVTMYWYRECYCITHAGLPYGLWSLDNKTEPLASLGYYQGRFTNGLGGRDRRSRDGGGWSCDLQSPCNPTPASPCMQHTHAPLNPPIKPPPLFMRMRILERGARPDQTTWH